MKWRRIRATEMTRYAPDASPLFLETVVTYLEAGGLFPGWLGNRRSLYVYDATCDPEDYFNSYYAISFEKAVEEAVGTAESFLESLQKKLTFSRRSSREYAEYLKELGRVKGDLIILSLGTNSKSA